MRSIFYHVTTSSLQPVRSPPVRLIKLFNDPTVTSTTPLGHKAPYIPKIAAEDTTLTVSNADGGKTTFPVLSGTEIRLHVPGLHYNRELSDIVSRGQVLIKSLSAVLEGPSQVYAREVPR